MARHEQTGPQSCSCGTPGFLSLLTPCGHTTWTHGEPVNIDRRGGAWISCDGGCQAQRRIVSVMAVAVSEPLSEQAKPV